MNKKVFQESSIPFDVRVSDDKFVVYATIFKIYITSITKDFSYYVLNKCEIARIP